MASKFLRIRKVKIRTNYEYFNLNRFTNELLNNDSQIPVKINYYNNVQGKLYSRSMIRSKCILSGRARGVFNNFSMSRLVLKKYGGLGFVNGLRKATW